MKERMTRQSFRTYCLKEKWTDVTADGRIVVRAEDRWTDDIKMAGLSAELRTNGQKKVMNGRTNRKEWMPVSVQDG